MSAGIPEGRRFGVPLALAGLKVVGEGRRGIFVYYGKGLLTKSLKVTLLSLVELRQLPEQLVAAPVIVSANNLCVTAFGTLQLTSVEVIDHRWLRTFLPGALEIRAAVVGAACLIVDEGVHGEARGEPHVTGGLFKRVDLSGVQGR